MRKSGDKPHSFADRLVRANIPTLPDDFLKIGILADSPNSSDLSCEKRSIGGAAKKQIGAVAQIMRDHPEHVLGNSGDLPEMERLKILIHSLPDAIKREVLNRLENNLIRNKKIRTAPGGQSGKGGQSV